MKVSLALVLILTCSASAALAQERAVPVELKQLDYFVGSWICEGRVYRSDTGPQGRSTYATQAAKFSLGGRWLMTESSETDVKGGANPLLGHAVDGWDLVKKEFVRFSVTNSGSLRQVTTKGWKGDSWVVEGEVSGYDGKHSFSRSTIMKKSATEYDSKGELSTDGKTWTPFREAHCKKE